MRKGGLMLLVAGAAAACGGRVRSMDAAPITEPTDASTDAPIGCAPPPIDVYAPNMTKQGSKGWHFQLVESRPAPPKLGSNTFIVRVTDPQDDEPAIDLLVTVRSGRQRSTLQPTIKFDVPSGTFIV